MYLKRLAIIRNKLYIYNNEDCIINAQFRIDKKNFSWYNT